MPTRALQLATLITAMLAFPLVWLGGLVTTHAAGLSVPDWPNSFGYNMFALPWNLWLGQYASGTFYEHSHRLLGSAVGLAAFTAAMVVWSPGRSLFWHRLLGRSAIGCALVSLIVLIIALRLRDTGRIDESSYKIWTHVFSGFAGLAVMCFIACCCRTPTAANVQRRRSVTLVLVLVTIQGLIGGSRVTEVSLWLARIHGVLGQITFATAAIVAAMCSGRWAAAPRLALVDGRNLRSLASVALLLISTQLILGALMRHDPRRSTGAYDGAAGLAIPDWPLHYGKLLPPTNQSALDALNWKRMTTMELQPVTLGQVWLHFAHRIGAYSVALTVLILGIHVFVHHRDDRAAVWIAGILVTLVACQITLGVYTVLKRKPADIATAHQATGALLLMTASVLLARTMRVYSLARARPAREVSGGFTTGTFVGPTVA